MRRIATDRPTTDAVVVRVIMGVTVLFLLTARLAAHSALVAALRP